MKLPFYAKATIIFIGFFVLLTMLKIAQNIIVPLIFAVMIAIVLHPVVDFMVRKKINRVVAIALALFLTFIIIAAFSALFISQASRFSESWPILAEKFNGFLDKTVTAVSGYIDINPQKIYAWITKTKSDIINTSTAAIGQTFVIIGGAVVILFLLPVYVFLILFYQPILLEFIHRCFGTNDQGRVSKIVTQIKSVIQRYIIGLVIEAVIVATLDIGALVILGIDYAILIGILGGLLNVIPYVGGLVAVAMPVMVALATKSPLSALYVLIAYYIIQLIDNNFIVPKIVASKVKINALFAIIVVIAGNSLWGIPGMFLSLPLLAIVKVICDHIEPLKPWGFLLGDTMPSLLKMKLILKKKNKSI